MTSLIEFLIGKLFIYFLLALITAALVEVTSMYVNGRSKILEDWIFSIFDGKVISYNKYVSLGQAILDHCLLTGLSAKGKSQAYINEGNFVNALLEKISYDPNNPADRDQNLLQIIESLEKTEALSIELKRTFLLFADEVKANKTGNELESFKAKIEKWFRSSMGALTGAYKIRYARPFTLFYSILIVTLLNVDSLLFVKMLYNNSASNEKTIKKPFQTEIDSSLYYVSLIRISSKEDTSAITNIKQHLLAAQTKYIESEKEQAPTFSVGWHIEQLQTNGHFSIFKLFEKILGLFATTLIIFLLAPFLFDLANKYSNIRGTGPSER